MNRNEAFRILGLDDDASLDDVKAAYKEMVQILHPDRFASSKKLQDRATEQFKNLQEAYDFLLSSKGGKKSTSSSAGQSRTYSTSNEYEARLAGIAAARTQLVAQRDTVMDERRNGALIAGVGVVLALFLRRIPIAIALGTTAIVWGVIQLVSAQSTINNLSEHIKQLNAEQRKILEKIDDLDEE